MGAVDQCEIDKQAFPLPSAWVRLTDFPGYGDKWTSAAHCLVSTPLLLFTGSWSEEGTLPASSLISLSCPQGTAAVMAMSSELQLTGSSEESLDAGHSLSLIFKKTVSKQ